MAMHVVQAQSTATGKMTDVPVEHPETLSNAAGAVVWDDRISGVRVDVTPDDAMRKIGITGVRVAGVPTLVSGMEVVPVESSKGRGYVKLDGRPELRALLGNAAAISRAVGDARARFWAEDAKAGEEADRPAREAMLRREAELVAQIPAGNVRVEAVPRSDGDGGTFHDYRVGDTMIPWDHPALVDHGGAAAIRPGALGAFDHRVVKSIPQATVEALRAEQSAKAQAVAESRRAREHDLATTPVPAAAVEAYSRYQGDADRAWDAEDEDAWSLINTWGDHVERQGLARRAAAARGVRELRAAAREQSREGLDQ